MSQDRGLHQAVADCTRVVRRLREQNAELLEALMAASLHLMVRPENRMPQADKNVADIVRNALAKAKGEHHE